MDSNYCSLATAGHTGDPQVLSELDRLQRRADELRHGRACCWHPRRRFAGASVGYGLGANALVGGTAKNFGLQPLIGATNTGLKVPAGVSRLQMRSAR